MIRLATAAVPRSRRPRKPTPAQLAWLRCGLDQPGGKLPLFDGDGQKVKAGLVEACLAGGWAERWFRNPLKPDWLVCRLTEAGRAAIQAVGAADETSPMTDAARG